MKIWYPLPFDESKQDNVPSYIMQATLDLYVFEGILKRELSQNTIKWAALNQRFKTNTVIELDNAEKFNILTVANQYINCLQCYYDAGISRCYYDVPKTIKVVGTTVSLEYLIRLIEFGNDSIPPLNWIRHSYQKFVEYILEGKKK